MNLPTAHASHICPTCIVSLADYQETNFISMRRYCPNDQCLISYYEHYLDSSFSPKEPIFTYSCATINLDNLGRFQIIYGTIGMDKEEISLLREADNLEFIMNIPAQHIDLGDYQKLCKKIKTYLIFQ